MKPCRNFKKRITLSITENQNDATVQEHLLRCTACRAFAEEIRAVCAEHTDSAAHVPSIDAPLRLHANVAAAVRGVQHPWIWSWIRPVIAGGSAALVIALYLHWRPTPQSIVVAGPPQYNITVTEPSYGAYRSHLSRSAEELDLALSRHDSTQQGENQLLKLSSQIREVN